jgi:hypothetical protein
MAKAVKAGARTARKSRPTRIAAVKPTPTKSRESKTSRSKSGVSKTQVTKTRTSRSPATTVMGVRIPKTLTNALDALVNSPRGREILAGALVAAASAAAAALVKRSDSPQVAKAREAVSDVGDQVARATKVAAGALSGIVTDAARSLLPASPTRKIKKR